PQKGADTEMAKQMDEWLKDFAELSREVNPEADPEYPGSGAAGGLGFALRTFLNASLESGISMILNKTGMEEHIKSADLVITGEGKLDGQSVMGKTPTGVAKLAKKYDKPVIAFSGIVSDDAVLCNDYGIDAFFPITREIISMDEAMKPEMAKKNLADAVEQVYRLITLFEKV
nr:glycerate kinase [Lachnospiraceae bacterium]